MIRWSRPPNVPLVAGRVGRPERVAADRLAFPPPPFELEPDVAAGLAARLACSRRAASASRWALF
jgi:hypothetical protein